MKKVSGPQVVTGREASEMSLAAEIQAALGEPVDAAREGLLALSVGVGLRVVHELMEAEVIGIAGAKGKWNPERTASRHGHEAGSMTLGGRRVPVSRPRVRTADGTQELPLASYEYFADRDPLQRAVMDRILAGVSTRKYERVGEPVGSEVEQTATATKKSSVSEMFIEKTRTALEELMARRLEDVRLAVMMLDGLEIAGRTQAAPRSSCRSISRATRAATPSSTRTPTTDDRPTRHTSRLAIGRRGRLSVGGLRVAVSITRSAHRVPRTHGPPLIGL